MDADLSEVETRLLSILKRAAASALANGRADSVVTTERQFWNLHEGQGEGDRMLGLPKAPVRPVLGVLDGRSTDQDGGWHLFVGDGPRFELWEGTPADYERAERIVRAVVQGKCRRWWPRQEVRRFLRPWRKHDVWERHAEVVLPDEVVQST